MEKLPNVHRFGDVITLSLGTNEKAAKNWVKHLLLRGFKKELEKHFLMDRTIRKQTKTTKISFSSGFSNNVKNGYAYETISVKSRNQKWSAQWYICLNIKAAVENIP